MNNELKNFIAFAFFVLTMTIVTSIRDCSMAASQNKAAVCGEASGE